MQDIKFRGYDTDSKVWRYGYYFLKEDVTLSPIYNSKEQYEKDKKENEHHLILMNGFSDWNLPKPHYQSEVDGNSVGRYTGLKDKNGKEIYEGDILWVTDDDGCTGQIDTGVGEVEFLEGLWYICGNVQNGLFDINKCRLIEVIGNIYENPDLLHREGRDNE